ncbi:hypothetical protein ACFL0V_04510 [Nanoarchaeota archaeon]
MSELYLLTDKTTHPFVVKALQRNGGVMSLDDLGPLFHERFGFFDPVELTERRLLLRGNDPLMAVKIRGKRIFHPRYDGAEKLERLYDEVADRGGLVKCLGYDVIQTNLDTMDVKSSGTEIPQAIVDIERKPEFEYALIYAAEVPQEVVSHMGPPRQGLAQIKRSGWGRKREEGLTDSCYVIFVIGDQVPQEYRECIAVHEYVEVHSGLHEVGVKYEFLRAQELDILEGFTKFRLPGLVRNAGDDRQVEALKGHLPAASVAMLNRYLRDSS